MPEFSFDYKRLLELIWQELQLDEVKASVTKLRGIDWNPFNDDGDEYVGVFAEIDHNWDLIFDVAVKAAAVAERAVVSGVSLSNPQKHKAVVEVLDGLIRAPWYVEPFDSIILDGIIHGAVKFLQAVNWGVELPPSIPAKVEFNEIG